MSLPLKIILPVAGGSAGLAVAIPFTISSGPSNYVKSPNHTTSSQSLDSTVGQQHSLSEPSRVESSSDNVTGSESLEGSNNQVSLGNSTSSSQISEQSLSTKEAHKIDDCKEIASSWEGRLIMCYDKKKDKKVTFKFINFLEGSKVDNIQHQVGNLSYVHPNNLKVEVFKIDNGGKNDRVIWLDLHEQAYGVNGSFTLNNASFTQDKCHVEWKTDAYVGAKADWKVTC